MCKIYSIATWFVGILKNKTWYAIISYAHSGSWRRWRYWTAPGAAYMPISNIHYYRMVQCIKMKFNKLIEETSSFKTVSISILYHVQVGNIAKVHVIFNAPCIFTKSRYILNNDGYFHGNNPSLFSASHHVMICQLCFRVRGVEHAQ